MSDTPQEVPIGRSTTHSLILHAAGAGEVLTDMAIAGRAAEGLIVHPEPAAQ